MLTCHPDTHPEARLALSVTVGWAGQRLSLRYALEGEVGAIRWPELERPGRRRDGLWQSTCFEAFISPLGSDAYFELNFCPSRNWASYRFANYREGRIPALLEADVTLGPDMLYAETIVEAAVDLTPCPEIGKDAALALSAVIEEVDGTKSYWALAHPPGKPDFHHPACFAATLPAPSR